MSFVLPEHPEDLLKHVPGQFCIEELVAKKIIPIKVQGMFHDLSLSQTNYVEF